MKKTLSSIVTGLVCISCLTAMDDNYVTGSTQDLKPFGILSMDICKIMIVDIELKSAVQLRGVSRNMKEFITNEFKSLCRHQIPSYFLDYDTDKIIDMLANLNIFPNLTVLRLGQMGLCLNVTDEGLGHLHQAKLKQLSLGGCYQVTANGFGKLNLTDLEQLDISNCGGLMNGQVPYERLTKLTSLNMKCFEVNNDEELNRLTLCTNLISLDLESWPRITNEGVRGLLTALTKLRTLNLSECWGITSLTGLPLTNLHELMIAGCWQISTEEFEGLDSRTKILR